MSADSIGKTIKRWRKVGKKARQAVLVYRESASSCMQFQQSKSDAKCGILVIMSDKMCILHWPRWLHFPSVVYCGHESECNIPRAEPSFLGQRNLRPTQCELRFLRIANRLAEHEYLIDQMSARLFVRFACPSDPAPHVQGPRVMRFLLS